jgi:Cytochrome c554 and c-prime/Tetratricopeptide repeat
MKRCLGFGLLLLLAPSAWGSSSASRCAPCHPVEVEGYARSAMAHSLRRPADEPQSSFVHALSGTKFTIYSDAEGFWQRLERDGSTSDYKVDYVIGSGNHATGYLVRMGNHLFQSPITYYSRTKRYDMAPGYEENRTPDFIRAVTEECLTCHSGKPLHIPGTLNEYQTPAFAQEAISCERCHGDATQHLQKPVPGSIVNPAKLARAARDSICEQCHLKGSARVLNPGKDFTDFSPGETLDQTYSIYTLALPHDAPRSGLKVISHVEQLALSTCARSSNGRLWCATCHNPHDQAKQPAEYFRARCMTCHEGKLAKEHPEGYAGNCVGCHMPRRNAKDGGHTVFTDHRISRHPAPEQEKEIPEDGDLVAWREPPPNLRERNLALAYVTAGLENQFPSQVSKGYAMLLGAEKQFPDDPDILSAKGRVLLAMKRPAEAAEVFERVLELRPGYALDEGNAGKAWLQARQMDKAVPHLERALKIDPLLLPVAEVLVQVYRQQGDMEKLAALADHVREAMGEAAPQEGNSH